MQINQPYPRTINISFNSLSNCTGLRSVEMELASMKRLWPPPGWINSSPSDARKQPLLKLRTFLLSSVLWLLNGWRRIAQFEDIVWLVRLFVLRLVPCCCVLGINCNNSPNYDNKPGQGMKCWKQTKCKWWSNVLFPIRVKRRVWGDLFLIKSATELWNISR